ncbi:MAG: hypothetical protein R2875_06330 [Desulfobacterales bacterium]
MVGKSLEKIITKSPGRVVVALFASNIARIQQVVDIIKTGRRKIVFNGRSIEWSVQTALI